MINHGDWTRYEPTPLPEGWVTAMYWQRTADQADWYQWTRENWGVQNGADTTGTMKVLVVDGVVISRATDVTMLGGPSNFTLYELEDGDSSPQLGWHLDGGSFAPPVGVTPVVVVFAVDLWTRLTEDEAEEVAGAMSLHSLRVRKIFESANSYRSDHELWPLLKQVASDVLGAERSAVILAPSEQM